MKKIKNKAGMAVWLLGLSLLAGGPAQAALIDRGGGLIYDTDLNITWLADANYGAGSSYDNGLSSTDGRMTWGNAVAWADQLNYAGYSDWRLPTSDTCIEFNCTGSELGHLFYVELGGTANSSILTSGDPDLSLFQNIELFAYWSGTVYAPNPSNAWYFGTGLGRQRNLPQSNEFEVWAVCDGDVAALAVPEPGTVALLGLALGGLAVARRRQNRSRIAE